MMNLMIDSLIYWIDQTKCINNVDLFITDYCWCPGAWKSHKKVKNGKQTLAMNLNHIGFIYTCFEILERDAAAKHIHVYICSI